MLAHYQKRKEDKGVMLRGRMATRQKKWTTALVYLAAVVERTDEGVLPALYFFVGRSLGATPYQLGALTFWRAIFQSVCGWWLQALSSPLSGVLGDVFDRTKVIAAGCFIWGIMTSAIATSSTLLEAKIYAAVNGIGLALVIPCCQSIIADSYSPDRRGRAFGVMQFTGSIGAIAGGLFATNLGHRRPFGHDGWRVALHIVAIFSAFTGALVFLFGRDPRALKSSKDLEMASLTGSASPRALSPASHNSDPWESPSYEENELEKHFDGGQRPLGLSASSFGELGRLAKEMWWLSSVRTFQVIILQGIVGSLPWNAMVFFTLWLQLLGFSDFVASALMAFFQFGTALGGILGGAIADKMSVWYPNNGRIFVAQFSVLVGIPGSLILLQVLPRVGVRGLSALYGLVLFTMALFMSWCQAGCNSPIFADIVPKSLYSKVYAFDRSLEGSIAATAAPLVGLIAEKVFGFEGNVATGRGVKTGNAASLGNSLAVCMVVPFVLCFVFYSGLHWTYPRDRNKARGKRVAKELLV